MKVHNYGLQTAAHVHRPHHHFRAGVQTTISWGHLSSAGRLKMPVLLWHQHQCLMSDTHGGIVGRIFAYDQHVMESNVVQGIGKNKMV